MPNIGVIGGGQLAQMLAQAAEPLNLRLHALVNELDCPAQRVAQLHLGNYRDPVDLKKFFSSIDLLSFEFENIDASALEGFSLPIYPSLAALSIAQDREKEKACFIKNNIPTTQYCIANDVLSLEKALQEIGFPCMVKTCREGYDGKGQRLLKEKVPSDELWNTLGRQRLIVENLIPFDREVSQIIVRDRSGNIVAYPLTVNYHEQGILRLSIPDCQQTPIAEQARQYVAALAEALDYVGVLTVEFFQQGDTLIANEMAPRVHNSGHWTIEGAVTSQFENHLRAIAGLPLGDPYLIRPSAMINFIGTLPAVPELLKIPDLHLHLYGKSERAGRKLGHATLCASTPELLADRLRKLP